MSFSPASRRHLPHQNTAAHIHTVSSYPRSMDNSTMTDEKRGLHHDDGVKASAPSTNYGPALTALMASVRERITVSSIRTLFSCIGVGESAPFNVPPQNQIAARMKTNANYFLTNYLLATAVVFFFLLYVLEAECDAFGVVCRARRTA
ncbi:hypothetical protein FI667_g2174, partial [Globisporangium splendens]